MAEALPWLHSAEIVGFGQWEGVVPQTELDGCEL